MLQSVATIQRPTTGQDTLGSTTFDPFTTVASGLACSYQEGSASKDFLYNQPNAFVSPTVYFDQDPATEPNDIISIFSPLTGVTVTVLVQGEAEPVMMGVLWSVAVTRIRAPQ